MSTAVRNNQPASALVLVEPDCSGEAIHLAELDGRIVARAQVRPKRHWTLRPPDSFKFKVDTSVKKAIIFEDKSAHLAI
jgi:hypothetical protein